MRTTLDIDDVVLAAARALAAARKVSIGAAVSELALRGLAAPTGESVTGDVSYSPFPILVEDLGHVVTIDLVNAHRDDV